MEENTFNNHVDITEVNKHVLQFLGAILTQFQDVLDDRELDICELLVEGRSRAWVANYYSISEERVRQIFSKSIKTINTAYGKVLQKMEEVAQENIELNHKIYVLENETLSSEAKMKADGLFHQEQSLCARAKRLLNVPVRFLPLSGRVTNILEAANALTFKSIPLLTLHQLYRVKNCGEKTIYDIVNYLAKFKLELGMSYEDVVSRMATLSDEDITLDNFGGYMFRKKPVEQVQEIITAEQLKQLTLTEFCSEMGRGEKAKKVWGSKVKRLLLNNQIDTLEKFLAMTPSEFEALKGVGPSTIKHVRNAFAHFGLEWSDQPENNILSSNKD